LILEVAPFFSVLPFYCSYYYWQPGRLLLFFIDCRRQRVACPSASSFAFCVIINLLWSKATTGGLQLQFLCTKTQSLLPLPFTPSHLAPKLRLSAAFCCLSFSVPVPFSFIFFSFSFLVFLCKQCSSVCKYLSFKCVCNPCTHSHTNTPSTHTLKHLLSKIKNRHK